MRRYFSSEHLVLNPYDTANFFSKWTFWYTVVLFRKGYKKQITEQDLTIPLEAHKSSIVGDKLSQAWIKEVDKFHGKKRTPSLHRALNKCFGHELVFYGMVAVIAELGIRIHQPLFIGLLLRFFDHRNIEKPESNHYPMYLNRFLHYFHSKDTQVVYGEAVVFLIGIIMCSALHFFIMHPVLMAVGHVGMKMRIAACSLMYRKALRLSFNAIAGKTVGNVMNLMANDVTRFDNVTMFTPYIFIGPTQLLFCVYFVYHELGTPAFFGALVVVCAICIQVMLGRCTRYLRKKTAKKTDDRVFLTNEIVHGVQVIKMFAWEYFFEKIILRARQKELYSLMQNSYIKGTIMSFIMFTTRFAVFMTVFVAVKYDAQILSVEQVFFIVGYYQIMRHTMTVNFPQGIANLAEFDVAVERIKIFLLLEESTVGDPSPMRKSTMRRRSYLVDKKLSDTIKLKNVSCKFGDTVVLENINLTVKRGQLAVIVGEVGSGKSCVLYVVLGELIPYQGTLDLYGLVSYASQEPWLFAASVRQNILFGHEYNRERYQEVTEACALVRDFSLLPYGDQTIVGERGISLSGGQRARVNLARAIYKQADIYLLDDPLSAVDPSVSKHLFQKCIYGFLRDKIVILCTHQLHHLKPVKQIIIMKEGKINMEGNFDEVRNSGITYAQYFRDTTNRQEEHSVDDIVKALPVTPIEKDHPDKMPTTDVEGRAEGGLSLKVYLQYFQAGGNLFMMLMVVFLFILSQGFISGADFFMNEWIQSDQRYYIYNETLTTSYQNFCHKHCLSMFCGSIGLLTFVSLTRSYYFYFFFMRASNKLHGLMFHSIITAKMSFFFTNTSGRILNRFSKDLGTVDEYLPNSFLDFNQLFLNLVGTVAIFTIIEPYLIIPSLMMVGSFFVARWYYMKTARTVKRLEATTKSPVYSHLNATLQGLGTIRTHGTENLLVHEFDEYQDDHSSAFFMFTVTSRAFGYIMDFLCVLYITTIATFFFVIKRQNRSDAGLCITQGMGLSGIFQWGMRQSTELENLMTSVERVLEYTILDSEPKLHADPGKKPPSNWPKLGRMEFRNMSLKYNLLEPDVLHNLNFVIESKEKVGIVGRTGAGKSSLISAIFRLSYIKGDIIIDGINTGSIGLHDLRKNISIIPQEPILFTGTMRSNLDPFNEYDDKIMYKALLDVEIRLALQHGIKCLDHYMAEGGFNFSVGERQLICLARAIIRNNTILILDEATANVDPLTDKFIQATIRSAFANCTVLTIAHRINTVIDSDKVLVMDAGTCIEFDHPHILLSRNSIFADIIEKTGAATAEQLRKEAFESYKRKFQKSGGAPPPVQNVPRQQNFPPQQNLRPQQNLPPPQNLPPQQQNLPPPQQNLPPPPPQQQNLPPPQQQNLPPPQQQNLPPPQQQNLPPPQQNLPPNPESSDESEDSEEDSESESEESDN